jgi:MFS transporter, ACS family, pantothenate transporter
MITLISTQKFYIPDPTLTFVGVPYYTSTFSMFEFQAEVVARVFAGLAALPSEEAMRSEYASRKAKGEKGKAFHSLIQNQVPYMQDILVWINEDVEGRGAEPMKGVDEEWYRGYDAFKEKSRRLLPVESHQILQPIASRYYTSDK